MTCQHPDGCPRAALAHGWCNAHYLRLKIHGEVGPAEIKRTRPEPRLCAAPDCPNMRLKRDWCAKHYERWRAHGDVTVSLVPRGDPGYLAVHKQVHRKRGKATSHACAHCGEQAKQWAYDHQDPNERVGVMVVRGYEEFHIRYSQDTSHYLALCIPCHRTFDREAMAV